MSEKHKIISDTYFDRAGYGSVKTTLQDAKKKNPSIQMEDVKQLFSKSSRESHEERIVL